jgi:hypothetical protein
MFSNTSPRIGIHFEEVVIPLKMTDADRQLYRDRLIHFTILSQKIERYNNQMPQKKYEITCNEGSLSATGRGQRDITVIVTAVTIDGARRKFEMEEENRVYGRRIKWIREVQ